MRRALRGVGALLALILLVFVLQIAASESGEVVVLRTQDANGRRRRGVEPLARQQGRARALSSNA